LTGLYHIMFWYQNYASGDYTMEIVNALNYPEGVDTAIRYIHSKWGDKDNLAFYTDAIIHSGKDETSLPQFYLAIQNDTIIGCFALITNDFISRHDLFPWFACLFVEPEFRGKQLGNVFMDFACAKAAAMGFATLYLTTDHDGFYERYGWLRIEDGFEPGGKKTRIYMRYTSHRGEQRLTEYNY
jgi:N-acetylglutamate synthase-like GNAT family acetyltransferase